MVSQKGSDSAMIKRTFGERVFDVFNVILMILLSIITLYPKVTYVVRWLWSHYKDSTLMICCILCFLRSCKCF